LTELRWRENATRGQLQSIVVLGIGALLVSVTTFARQRTEAAGISLLTMSAFLATPELLAIVLPPALDATGQPIPVADPPPLVQMATAPFVWLASSRRARYAACALGCALAGVCSFIAHKTAKSATWVDLGMVVGLGLAWAGPLAYGLTLNVIEATKKSAPTNDDVREWMWKQRRRPALFVASALFIIGTAVQLVAAFRG